MPVDVKADVCTNVISSQSMNFDNESTHTHLAAGDSSEERLVPADDLFPQAKTFFGYTENNLAYKVTLQKSDVLRSLNEFYILQLLKDHKQEKFVLWSRNGCVGSKGATQSLAFGKNIAEAKNSFERRFFELTSNNWNSIANFKKVEGMFDLVRTNVMSDITSKPAEKSNLPKKLLSLLKLIANKDMLEEAAKELMFDANVIRLSSITAEQINEGYRALDNLTKVILAKGSGKDIVAACNDFYTKIPHCFKPNHVPLILTINEVKEKLRMLEALSNISLAINVIDRSSSSLHHLDKCYAALKCSIDPLSHLSREFKALKECLVTTRGPTHDYNFELVEAFSLSKDAPFKNVGNNALLFHGSRLTNWVGILKNGLMIAPYAAPTTGYMFGKGIYFSDVATKSCFYCFATRNQNHGLLLLCEVSLGNSYKAYESDDVINLPKQFNSVHAVGQHAPTGFKSSILSSDAKIPYGSVEPVETSRQTELLYNEYVVYDAQQVKMKYLMRLKFEV